VLIKDRLDGHSNDSAKPQITIKGRKSLFFDLHHPFIGKHLLDACSFTALLVQDSGSTIIKS